MSGDPSRGGLTASLNLTLLVGLGTAWLYTAGWSYAYRWFSEFELGLIGLDIPHEYLLLYGFFTLRGALWVPILVMVAGVVVWWLISQATTSSAWQDEVPTFLWRTALIWLLLAFLIAAHLGEAQGARDYRRHYDQGFARFPLAQVWVKPGALTSKLTNDLANLKYRVLFHGKGLDKLYLIKDPRVDAQGRPSGAPPTLVIPVGSLQAWRLAKH